MMKRLSFSILILTVCSANGLAQNATSVQYAQTITQPSLRTHLGILASDALEGRETGERGQKMAAAYIESHFRAVGLAPKVPTECGPAYQQRFGLYRLMEGDISLTGGGETWQNHQEVTYVGWGLANSEQAVEVVFAGDGRASALAQLDLKGKAVAMYAESSWANWNDAYLEAMEQGAILAIFINKGGRQAYERGKSSLGYFLSGKKLSLEKPSEKDNPLGAFFTYPEVAATMMGTTPAKLENALKALESNKTNALRKIKPAKITYRIQTILNTLYTENVLGYLEGTDKKDELLVITAHYDHIGKEGDEVFNGADDDASGTSVLMALAEAFALAKAEGHGPRRSILFMAVTGEEKGLLGSSYYVQNPVFPLGNTVTNLNIDMVGRVDPKHRGKPAYIYLVGSDKLSTELHEVSENTNSVYTKLALDYTYNSKSHRSRIYYRSDHWNFAKNNIPVIFYFNGTHEDYHQATDTVEKIDFPLLAKRCKLVFHTAWALANRDKRVKLDHPKNN